MNPDHTIDGAFPWPALEGPFKVGVMQFDLTDPKGVAAYAPVPQRGRRLNVWAWYPATPSAGSAPKRYMTPQETEVLPAAMNALFQRGPDAQRYLGETTTCSVAGATPDPAAGPCPVLVFTHGGVAHVLQNTALMEHLASHGYVVLSVAHPCESGGIVHADGSTAVAPIELTMDLAQALMHPDMLSYLVGDNATTRLQLASRSVDRARSTWLPRLLNVWAEDLMFVVDALASGDVPDPVKALAGQCDTGRLGYFGMSYGGAVSLRACQLDPRAKAGVNMDGAMWTWDDFDSPCRTAFLALHSDPGLFVPILGALGIDAATLNGGLDEHTPLFSDVNFEPIRAAGLRPDIHRYAIRGIGHHGFTDNLLLYRGEHRAVLGPAQAQAPRLMRLQNDLVQQFFDRYLRGQDGSFPPRPDAHPELVRRELSGFRLTAQGLAQ